MKSGKKQTQHMSALLQYVERTKQSFARNIADAETVEEQRDERLTCDVTLWEVDAAQKYKLTSSALAMIARLKPDKGPNALKALPGTGVWMCLDDEKTTNVYFSSIAHAATSYFEAHPRARMPKNLESIVARPWLWDFQVMARDSHPL